MDPTQLPNQTSPEVSIPQPKPNYLKTILLSVLIIITLGLITYLLFQNQKLQKQVLNPPIPPTITVPTPSPLFQSVSPTSKTVSSISLSPDETTGWQTYENTEFVYTNTVYTGYSLLFPPTCTQEVSTINCPLAHGVATIVINAGGHGGEIMETKVLRNNEIKTIPAGDGKISEIEDIKNKRVFGTFWINKTDKLEQEPVFGFEFMNISIEDVEEFENMFDQILSTFKFTN